MTKRKSTRRIDVAVLPAQGPTVLLAEVRELILQAREGVARAVDSALTTLYWHVGRRVRQDILKEKRAEYGKKIVHALSAQLVAEFDRGFTVRNLFNMIRFAEVYPDPEIVSALRTQLGWTHFRQIIAMDDPLKRDFYAEMCRMEGWSTRTLEKKIGSMLFERTALSKKVSEKVLSKCERHAAGPHPRPLSQAWERGGGPGPGRDRLALPFSPRIGRERGAGG